MKLKVKNILLDKSNNLIEQINIIKPNTYTELIKAINNNFKNLSKPYNIYYQNEKGNQYNITNNEEYKLSKDILYVHKVQDNLGQSLFSLNNNQLSESKQEILEERYCCNLCEMIMKDEKPLLCYRCQNIFHQNCLENWNNQCQKQNRTFNCPKCRYELPLKKWEKKVNYDYERINEDEILDKLNTIDLDNNCEIIVMNKLKKEKHEKIKKYDKFKKDVLYLFRNIVIKIQ